MNINKHHPNRHRTSQSAPTHLVDPSDQASWPRRVGDFTQQLALAPQGGWSTHCDSTAENTSEGCFSRLKRSKGQTRMNAIPTTRFSEIAPPPGSPWCMRESPEWERLSPITHRYPSGTVVSNLMVWGRSEEHTSELQSRGQIVCR